LEFAECVIHATKWALLTDDQTSGETGVRSSLEASYVPPLSPDFVTGRRRQPWIQGVQSKAPKDLKLPQQKAAV
jgi:hypothetical protein